MPELDKETAQSRYDDLQTRRQPALDRARACSALTIPSLLPPQDFTDVSDLPTPYQSLGARGVNNLASKLMLALLPPAASFFRLMLSEKFRRQFNEQEVTASEQSLAKGEQAVLREIELRNLRANAFEGWKHLIVAGNVLEHLPEEGGLRVFPLSQYVVARDAAGNVLEIVVKEVVDVDRLPPDVREFVKAKRSSEATGTEESADDDEVDVYTRIVWDAENSRWRVCQEVLGEEIADTEATYPDDKLPWRPLRWSVVDGQDYGRGHCEEYYGDLQSLDALEKDILETAAVCASGRWLVNPNSGLDIEELNESKNWSYVEGTPETIQALQANKFADMKVVSDEISRIEGRLQYAFLLHTAVQRNAERVTAEEIRFVAAELEDTLGGVYSVMASEFQLPLVKLLINQMQKAGKFPDLPKDAVDPIVVAGIDSLGRSRQGMALEQLIRGAAADFGPAVMPYFRMGDYLTRMAASYGIENPKALIRSDDEVQQMQQQANQQQMVEKLGPSAIKGVSDNVKERTKLNAVQQQANQVTTQQ